MKKLADTNQSSSNSGSDKISQARVSRTKKAKGEKKKKVEVSSEESSESEEVEKLVVVKKGAAAVDQEFPEASCYHVYEDEDKVYNASMMLSDLKKNNNKFYIVQLLEPDTKNKEYILWTRWGRVGVRGQSKQLEYSIADEGKREYDKKHNAKKKVGYNDVEISYDEEAKENSEKSKEAEDGKKKIKPKNEEAKVEKTKLDERIQNLIKLIFNMKMMQKQMVEIGYDAKKLPLGKLSKETIKKGYEILKKIATALNNSADEDILLDLSSEFYSTIPHDFGFKYFKEK